jgi:hypothetical protein
VFGVVAFVGIVEFVSALVVGVVGVIVLVILLRESVGVWIVRVAGL